MAQKTHIDTLLDIMTTISLYHYVWLDMLNILAVIRECFSRSTIKNY